MFSDTDNIELSILIPLYNEEDNVSHLFERLMRVLNHLNIVYEIVCVNDGSKDNTLNHLVQYHLSYPEIKVINLSRNFGKEAALTAAIDYARGSALIPIDADLQDPPELIEELVKKWREGYDVVYAVRRSRSGDNYLKQLTAKVFYKIIEKISYVQIPSNTGDFRLLDRRVVNVIKQMPERTRFMKGIFAWVGFKQTSILYDRPQRYKGRTKWNYWRLWNLAIDGITSFSLVPLKIWIYVGIVLSLLAFFYAFFLIVRTLLFGIVVPGYASLMVTMLFLGGINLMILGIIGEYLGRVYEEVKQRPLYLVRDCYGFIKNNQVADKSLLYLSDKKSRELNDLK